LVCDVQSARAGPAASQLQLRRDAARRSAATDAPMKIFGERRESSCPLYTSWTHLCTRTFMRRMCGRCGLLDVYARSLDRSFVRSFVGSLVRWFVRWLVVRWFVRCLLPRFQKPTLHTAHCIVSLPLYSKHPHTAVLNHLAPASI